ncbi:MAG: UvrD-helicase domain-containing protein, partial [Lachnospiraceae bacterium]|nr:UvrD-helicase domain-containing protein [Lachnospiraceae bacterium]
NLRNALNELDRMQISTIHSFCHRILSEKMFDAGLPYGFTLAEESEMESLRERYFRLWAETLKRTDYEKLLPTGKYRSGVIDRIKNLTDQLDRIPDDYSIEVAVPDMSEVEVRAELDPIVDKVCTDALALVNRAYRKSYGKFEDIDDKELTSYGKKLKDALIKDEITPICKTLLSLPSTKSFIVRAVTAAEMKSMGIDKKDQSDFKGKIADKDAKIRQYIESRKDDIARLKAGYENPKFRPYIDYAKEAIKYIRERSADWIISNDMLLEKTKELVEASDDVRRFFGNKFRIIYVDEFQDTDHLQESFIRLLASDPDNPEKLRDGALFVVGDPKQSIYRFRGAEPEVYFDTKERMERLDNTYVVELSDNYRSNQLIIDWVNRKFASKDITTGQSYIPMNTGNPLPVSGLPDKLIAGVYKYKNPETVQSADDIYADRNALCMLIDSLIRNGYLIADRDKDNKVFSREIRYSDFLILCMNTPGMTEYAECFRKYGIPVIMDSKSDVTADHDLNSFIRLYAYLASPFDNAARMGALEALYVSGAADRELNEEVLKLMIKDTEGMSAYGCVKYLMTHPELYMRKDKGIEDYLVRDMQKKLIQMTEQIQAQTYGNRLTLLNAMREYCETVVEHELLPERDINAVRFMNLHKAKGLEGNIVIWTNRTENRAFREGEYRRGKTFYPSVCYTYNGRRNTEWSAYGGDSHLTEQARAEDESESVRLEYVAATRAKQALIFMDRYGKYDGNMFTKDYNLDSLDSVEEIVKEYNANRNEAEPEPYVPSGREEYLKEIKARDEQRQPVFSSESPSDYEDESAGRKVRRKDPYDDEGIYIKEVPYGQGVELYVEGDIAGMSESDVPGVNNNAGADAQPKTDKRPVGNIFGTVMHRTFELMVERWNCNPKILEHDKTTEL